MATLRTIAFCIFTVFALTAYANGAEAMVMAPNGEGTLTVEPMMQAGTQYDITYDCPSRAGETIEIHIRDTMGGDPVKYTVQLDGNGQGTVQWTAQNLGSGDVVVEADHAESQVAMIL